MMRLSAPSPQGRGAPAQVGRVERARGEQDAPGPALQEEALQARAEAAIPALG